MCKLPETKPTADRAASRKQAFTLVELLVVMGIMILLLGITVPAFNAIRNGSDLTKATYDIAGLFEQARTYAMSTHTYVFIGLVEVDVSRPDTASPQSLASSSAGGRVAVMMFAARDGSRGYSLNNPQATWSSGYAAADDGTSRSPGWRLAAVSKLARFENVHLGTQPPTATSGSLPNPPTGGMHRQTVNTTDTPSCLVGMSTCSSVTPISYPLGSAMTGGQYQFTTVIYFDPQGVARIQGATNSDNVDRYIEVGLQSTHGNVVPQAATANQGAQAAIQIDCMTGAVRIYRP